MVIFEHTVQFVIKLDKTQSIARRMEMATHQWQPQAHCNLFQTPIQNKNRLPNLLQSKTYQVINCKK